MTRTTIFLLTVLLTASPALGVGFYGPTDGMQDLGYSCYGCTSLAFQGSVVQMRLRGIWPNTAVYSAPDTDLDIKTADGTCRDTDYLALARLAGALATSGNIPRPFILDLSAVIFGTTPARSCTVSSDAWSVRSDWQARLSNFKAVSGTNFNTSTVWAIVISAEVANPNGRIADNAAINQIAAYVKQLWPGIPVMAGYPTNAILPDYGMQYTPSIFPWQLDYIVTWDYTVTAPTDPRYAGDGVNPGAYGSLLSRLRSYQNLLYNVGAFNFSGPPTTCPARSPINGERFDLLVRRWCSWFATHRAQSLGLVTFLWGPAQHHSPTFYGAQRLIDWELSQCGGEALKPALISATNAASMGTSCWQ